MNKKISTVFPKLCVKVFHLSLVSCAAEVQSHGPTKHQNYFFFWFKQGLSFAVFTIAKAKELFNYLALLLHKSSVWTAVSRF